MKFDNSIDRYLLILTESIRAAIYRCDFQGDYIYLQTAWNNFLKLFKEINELDRHDYSDIENALFKRTMDSLNHTLDELDYRLTELEWQDC